MARFRLAVFAVALLAGCGPKSSVTDDSELASCIPSDTVVLAGVQLDQIRSTPAFAPLLGQLPAIADTSNLIIAYNGRSVLFLGKGRYRAAPPGATLIAQGIAASGAPESIQAATTQHRSGASGAPRLLEIARGTASGRPIWMVAQGGITLPFSGNAENLNRILRLTQYITVTAQADSRMQIDASLVGRNANAARQLEESLRAILSIASAASTHQAEMESTLKSIRIDRDDLTVHASASTTTDALMQVLK